MTSPTAFGELLRSMRRDVTHRELSMRVKLTDTYLRYMENGQMPPPPAEVVMRLATALKCSPTEMLRLSIAQREEFGLDVPRARGVGMVALAADIVEVWPLVDESDLPALGKVLAAVKGKRS